MQFLVKTRNHQFGIWKAHISHQPCTPFWIIFRQLAVQNCIANCFRILFFGLGRERCPRQNRLKTWMASTRSAHGSFNATKSCKNLLMSIGHCCSTLVEGSSRPVFGLRLALRAPVSASNDGIISFPNEKPTVRTPHCWAYIT